MLVPSIIIVFNYNAMRAIIVLTLIPRGSSLTNRGWISSPPSFVPFILPRLDIDIIKLRTSSLRGGYSFPPRFFSVSVSGGR